MEEVTVRRALRAKHALTQHHAESLPNTQQRSQGFLESVEHFLQSRCATKPLSPQL